MIYEGRILDKNIHNESSIRDIMYHIYKALGYIKNIEFWKDTVSLIYIKKDNKHDFFDKANELSMILIYTYDKCLEIPTQRAREEGLKTYCRFPDMMGRELAVLEIVHKYMEEYPDAVFYVDTGAYFTKTEIDMLYNLEEPDSEWIYKDPKKLTEG